MRHRILTTIVILLSFFTVELNAQGVSINETGAAAHSRAMLDIDRVGKGLLIPRMSQTFRDTITNPPTGLLIFNHCCPIKL